MKTIPVPLHPVRQRVARFLLGVITLSVSVPLSAQLTGIAGDYGAFAGSNVTNIGLTVIVGGIGVSPGSSITGFAVIDGGPGLFTGTLSQGDAAAAQAHDDIVASYADLAALAFTSDLSGQDLGGLTLAPGVYRFGSAAQLTGVLTLDAQGDANARFVFQIGSALTAATDSRVTVVNIDSVSAGGPGAGVYWQVGSSATIGTGAAFAGNILALESITLNTGASIDDGRALAINGGVTLDNNRIDASDTSGGFGGAVATPVPEPSTYGVAACGVLLLVIHRRLRQRRSPDAMS